MPEKPEVMHYLIVPLAFLSPENPRYEENKQGFINSVIERGHIDSWVLRTTTMLEDGLRIENVERFSAAVELLTRIEEWAGAGDVESLGQIATETRTFLDSLKTTAR